MQVCTAFQTDNHANTSPLKFFTGRMPFLPPNQQCQSTEAMQQSINISCPPDTLQQTHRTLQQQLIAGIDGWMDGWTDAAPVHRPCSILCEQCQKLQMYFIGCISVNVPCTKKDLAGKPRQSAHTHWRASPVPQILSLS